MASRAINYEKQLIQEIEKIPKEYLPILLQIVRLYRESVELKPTAESINRDLIDTLAGETLSITDLTDCLTELENYENRLTRGEIQW